MKRERKEKHFIQKPQYPGGPRAMHAFIYKYLKYPSDAREHGITGYVRVRINIDYEGKVVGTKVVHHLGHGCDEEAERVLKLLKFEVPKNRGVKVQFHKTLRIRFKPTEQPVTAPQPAPAQTTFRYQITGSDKPSSGYNYTIKL